MKIWFEITNSPHINLFANIIRELEKEHEITITCRPLANTIELLKLHDFRFTVIGKHYGKYLLNKIIGFPIRVFQLFMHFKNNKPDVAIGQSSFQMPFASKLLGVPCIYMNDNEHAKGNILSFLFADIILIPEFYDKRKVIMQLGKESKIIKYPGLKEGIYLWRIAGRIDKGINNNRKKKTIYYRPEPHTAEYYSGNTNLFTETLLEISKKYNIIISPRDHKQKTFYRQEKFNNIRVLNKPMDIESIITHCDMFIGAGGTMSREMAVMGVPTVSIYQDDLLDVDRYLINIGLLKHKKDIDLLYIEKLFMEHNQSFRITELLNKGKEAEKLILETIIDLGLRL